MKTPRDKLIELCAFGMQNKNLMQSDAHKNRLKLELKEIDDQGEHDYFLDLHNKGTKCPRNENNILIPYLLGIVDDFEIERDPVYTYGEFPDIDVDYLPAVRDYLKNDWAPKAFGERNVCNIGSFGTFGIRGSLIDMTRVFGEDRTEILSITTQMGLKDEEGKTLHWESAVDLYKNLAEFVEKHTELADASKRLIGRNRSKGKHAGGLIVSKSPIDRLVPIMIDTEGNPASSWTEGLGAQDLMPVGLVKFDLLVITDLLRIAICCKLIKDRYPEMQSICSLPDQYDWSDTVYLNDPKSLALASEGRTMGIFQFSSFGIRRLLVKGGVSSFDDLVAYSALYRPGPLGMRMQERYIERKNGREEWEEDLHPLMKPILGKTYGVMCYQEQVMQILNVVGDIPLIHCEKVRKAISKKKEATFRSYKDMFVVNGQKNLGWDEKRVENLWKQIESFAEYGFNKSHAVAYTYISSRLLWLKAHYPLEFFASTLACETKDDNIKQFKDDANSFDIVTNRLSINQSKIDFSIQDEELYIGFSDVKGIGTEPAKRIEEGQPYKSFEDFLTRFGTDANIIKPLVGLRVFDDSHPVILYEFYEHFKKEHTKIEGRRKRYLASKEKNEKHLQYYLPLEDWEFVLQKYEEGSVESLKDMGWEVPYTNCTEECTFLEHPIKEIEKACKKLIRSRDNFLKKEEESAANPVLLENFTPTGDIDEKLKEVYVSPLEIAEAKYYGFSWRHILESSPDYNPERTFAQFEDDAVAIAPVQIKVLKVQEKEWKSKKGSSYYVSCQDANFKTVNVKVWKEDYEIFKDKLFVGEEEHPTLLSIKIEKSPWQDKDGNERYSFTLYAPPKWKRKQVLPSDPALDGRVIHMQEKIDVLDEIIQW